MTTESLQGGVVAAATPEAAITGVKTLEAGGNAIDAAVAVSLVLGVTEPAGSGIGGQATFLIAPPDREPFVLNGSTHAPAAIPQMARVHDFVGHRATTVPTMLATLDAAWQRHGSGRLTWQQLVEPAITWAVDGYELGPFRRYALQRHVQAIRANRVAARLLLTSEGQVPREGARVTHALLGKTLTRVALEGAEDFYRGEIAREIVRDMSRSNGWLSADDLREVRGAPDRPALHGTYRGDDVYTLPPPAAGWVVLLALNILERAPEGELALDGAARLVRIADALSRAHQWRVRRPPHYLRDHGASTSSLTSKEVARSIARGLSPVDRGETTHFSIVDQWGTMVSVTQSLNAYFGARVASPELGFLYNDYMREFEAAGRDHPFALRPGGFPYSSMSATTLVRRGRPMLSLGSPGDDRIISAVVQVLSRWVDVEAGIEEAVAAPRMHAMRKDELLLECPPPKREQLLALERRGYHLSLPLSSLFTERLNPYFGGVHAVAQEKGRWLGAADPRRDGQARVARPWTEQPGGEV